MHRLTPHETALKLVSKEPGAVQSQTMKLALKHTLAAIILVLILAAPVAADQFEDAVTAYGEGDYATALRLFRPLGDQGNSRAQNNLGIMYDNGYGAAQDYSEAAKWFRKAADQGNARAQCNLGVMYAKGQGVPQDYVSAYMWFSLSAAQGFQDGLKYRDTVAPHMTPAQIAEAQKLAAAAGASTSQDASQYDKQPIPIGEVPSFDVEVYCRKYAMFSPTTLKFDGEFLPSAFGVCKTTEQASYDALTGKTASVVVAPWDKLPAAVRQHCLTEVSVGEMSSSYVQLVACIFSNTVAQHLFEHRGSAPLRHN
jgi:Sel1 repeat